MRRFHLHELPSERWKNGGGNTRTILSFPELEPLFDWRVSVAEIAASGPFSRFQDIDRIAVVLENGPLKLLKTAPIEQVMQPLFVGETHKTVSFDGSNDYFADISGKTILCLNIMTRRNVAVADVRIMSANTIIDGKAKTLLFAAGKGWQAGAMRLGKYESIILDANTSLTIRAPAIPDGPLIAITIKPA